MLIDDDESNFDSFDSRTRVSIQQLYYYVMITYIINRTSISNTHNQQVDERSPDC